MENIIDYLVNPSLIPDPYLGIIIIVRILFIGFIFLLIGFIIYALISTSWFKFRAGEDIAEFMKFKAYGSDKYVKEWKKIIKRLDIGIEAEYKLAIMEVDTMLENMLEQMGYKEETIEKSLAKVGQIEISNIEELKEVRKVRNGVIHDPDYKLSKDKTKEVMDVYEATFKILSFL